MIYIFHQDIYCSDTNMANIVTFIDIKLTSKNISLRTLLVLLIDH